jgi:outer membrane protein OmpA-like peptidoglycan-associated protein
MKTIIIFLLIGLVFAKISYSQDHFDARVIVANLNDVPIPNAEVKLFDTTGILKFNGVTSKEGSFELSMSPGKYRVQLFQDDELKKDRYINLPVLEGRRVYHLVRIFVLYEERNQFTLENLLFEYNSAHIYEESFPILDKLVEYLNSQGDTKFEIGGHTDDVGTIKDNQILSENRANAVKDYLIVRGIAAERIVAIGYGEESPLAENESEDGRAKNRRTEVKKLE